MIVKLKLEVKERKRVECELIQSKEDAEAANRSKSEFLANMSHEFRTPLNHIIRLSLDITGIPDLIRVDERKCKQIIYNLLANAVKFTPDGGSITLSATYPASVHAPLTTTIAHDSGPSGDCMEITVTDTGIGLPQQNLERVFDSFTQGKSSIGGLHTQGTGLGLSLAKRMVELHGGRIWAESGGKGQGSTFRFHIPLQPEGSG